MVLYVRLRGNSRGMLIGQASIAASFQSIPSVYCIFLASFIFSLSSINKSKRYFNQAFNRNSVSSNIIKTRGWTFENFQSISKRVNRNNETINKKIRTNVPPSSRPNRLGHSLPTCCISKQHFRAMETNKRNNERIVFPQVIAPSKYHISRELPLFQSSQVNQRNAHRSWLIGDWLILPSSFRLVSSYSRVQSEGEGTPVVLGISHRSPELGRELGRVVMVSFDPDGIRQNGWSTWRADTPSMFLTCKRNPRGPSSRKERHSRLTIPFDSTTMRRRGSRSRNRPSGGSDDEAPWKRGCFAIEVSVLWSRDWTDWLDEKRAVRFSRFFHLISTTES